MAIPESQLDTWANQGSITQSSTTYNAIKGTLEASSVPFADKNYKVFLQGSYGNDTNIYAESDVDIVIQLASTFQQDLSALSDFQKVAFNKSFSSATYTYYDFKRDIMSVLSDAYGSGVKEGKKAIEIPAGGGRRKADVIVALEYRKYRRFNASYDQDYIEGIVFYTSTGEEIINYPKAHSTNLTTKHQSTGKWFKPMVRVLKNMRRRLVESGELSPGDGPSYYLEGLLYNVPYDQFRTSYGDCFCNALNWIQKADKSQLVCANEQYFLLRSGYHTCWDPSKCEKVLSAVTGLWNNW